MPGARRSSRQVLCAPLSQIRCDPATRVTGFQLCHVRRVPDLHGKDLQRPDLMPRCISLMGVAGSPEWNRKVDAYGAGEG